jgi:hypothetical protein
MVPPVPAPSVPGKPPPLRIDPSLGTVVTLSDADQLRLMTLEGAISEAITQGWKSFVDIGLALIEIKKGELYTAEFDRFEDYCRVKWDFKHSKANYLMAAAKVVKSLGALTDLPVPQRESPLRPLLNLEPDDARRAWKLALEKTGGRRITARVVHQAVQELKLAPETARPLLSNSQRIDRHRLINNCFGDLLGLVSQRADYSSVMEKVQELYGLVEGLFAKR